MCVAARSLCPCSVAPLLKDQVSQACRARGSCGGNHVEPAQGLNVPHMCDVVASQVLAAPADLREGYASIAIAALTAAADSQVSNALDRSGTAAPSTSYTTGLHKHLGTMEPQQVFA